jgi:hypothetical protein
VASVAPAEGGDDVTEQQQMARVASMDDLSSSSIRLVATRLYVLARAMCIEYV